MGFVLCIVFVFVFLSEMRKVTSSYKTLVVCLLMTSVIRSSVLGFSCLNVLVRLMAYNVYAIAIDSFHIVISLSNRSSIEKSIKLFLKMKGQIAY